MDPDNLMIDEIILGRASYIKRVEFKGRGRVRAPLLLRPLPPTQHAANRPSRPTEDLLPNQVNRTEYSNISRPHSLTLTT
jgi:hypothetical protein